METKPHQPRTSNTSSSGENSGQATSTTYPNRDIPCRGTSKLDGRSEAEEKNSNDKANKEKNTKEMANGVVELLDDKVFVIGNESKVTAQRHRRHSDGGGFLSFFMTAIICGSGTMKPNKQKNRRLKKKSKSTKKLQAHDMDYPPDQKKLPHDI
ncbi:hypothetical protein ACET3Z_024994 [Daucus carota]